MSNLLPHITDLPQIHFDAYVKGNIDIRELREKISTWEDYAAHARDSDYGELWQQAAKKLAQLSSY